MDMRELKEFFVDTFKYLIIIAVVLFIVIYVCTLQQVVGPSMEPNLNNQDILLLNKLVFKFRDPARFEVITFQYDNKQYLIKRVIGLPGENIVYKDNSLYIDDKLHEEPFLANLVTEDFSLADLGYITIPKDMYLVLGDNREDSLDSRKFGLITKKDMVGKPFLRIFPFNKMSFIE
ncbi:MAG: signal peptidase I [Bacilli bacterium]|nr:signal peptidase I [Bacilli bacterium]